MHVQGGEKKYDSLKNKQAGPTGEYPATTKLYFEDSYMFTASANVLGMEKVPDPKSGNELTVLILDQTCFYPQGGTNRQATLALIFVWFCSGGQPTDVGTIILADGSVGESVET